VIRAGATLVVLIVGAALVAPWLVPFDPASQQLALRLEGPSVRHRDWMGGLRPVGSRASASRPRVRVRRRRTRARRQYVAHADSPRVADCASSGHGSGHAGNGDRHTFRSVIEFPRPRCSAADPDLGHDDQRWPLASARCAAPGHLSRGVSGPGLGGQLSAMDCATNLIHEPRKPSGRRLLRNGARGHGGRANPFSAYPE
jgi:hypothetical protein